MEIIIRHETREDHRIVEELTRKAFWNLYVPGCVEHYLVHVMRQHEDFIPELDYVLETDHQIIGNIMYTKAKLIAETGVEKQILTFGPVCILPEYQRKGYGTRIIEHSFIKAKELGYDVVVIFGNPGNYVGLGFKSCSRLDISIGEGVFPTGMLVKELKEGTLEGQKWTYQDSDVYRFDPGKVETFDAGFKPLEKKVQASQEEFFILSNSRVIKNSTE